MIQKSFILICAIVLAFTNVNAQTNSIDISSAQQTISPNTTFNAWKVTAMSSDMQNAFCNGNTTGTVPPSGAPAAPPVTIGQAALVIQPFPLPWPQSVTYLSCFPFNTMYTVMPAETNVTNCTLDITRDFYICSNTNENVTFNFNVATDDETLNVTIDAGTANAIVLSAGAGTGLNPPLTISATENLSPGMHTLTVRGANGEDANGTYFTLPSGNQGQWNPFGMSVTGAITSTNNILLNSLPPIAVSPITGAANVCSFATDTLSDITPNGTWSSSNMSVATISQNGVVTGSTPGNSLISYTVGEGNCINAVTFNITVTNCCPASHCPLVNNLIINSGYNPVTKGPLTSGQKDANWIVTAMSNEMQSALCYGMNTTGQQGPPTNTATVPPVAINQYADVIDAAGTISCFPVNTIYTLFPPPQPATGNFDYTMNIRRPFYICSTKLESVTFNFTVTCDDAVDSIIIDAGSANPITILNVMTKTVGAGTPYNVTITASLAPGPHTLDIQCADWEDPSVQSYTVNGINYAWNPFAVVITGTIASTDNALVNNSCCPPTYSIIDTSICQGQSYLGHSTTGIYIDTLANIAGCDSIRTLTLTVNNCTLTCDGSLGEPFIDETFGAGPNYGPPLPSGSTSSLGYDPTNCPSDGNYAITNYTSGCWPLPDVAWFTATDHTGDPNGYFMLVNASYAPSDFYIKNVSGLCAGTYYKFSAWIMNMCSNGGTLPNITFTIEKTDSTVLAIYQSGDVPNATTPTWKQYSLYFQTPAGVSNVILRMRNNAPGGVGNDIGLDDITFSPCGPKTTASFSATNPLVDTLTICSNINTSVNLIGTVSAGLNTPAYQWQISNDSGATFTNIPGATTLNYTETGLAVGNYQFRLLSAEAENIGSVTCRFISDTIKLNVILCCKPTSNSYSYTICQGQSYWGHDTSGMFNDTLINVAGCDSIRTLTLTVNPSPLANAGNDSLVCKMLPFTLHGSGTNIVQYAWIPKSYLNDSTLQNPVATINTTTKFYLTVTNTVGCSAKDSVTISVQNLIVKTNNDTSICAGNSVQLNASGANTYSWVPSNWLSDATISNPVATPLSFVPYIVTGTSSIGCTANDTVNITVNQNPIVQTSNDTAICKGSSAQLITTGADNYSWTPPNRLSNTLAANPVATPPNSTKYFVTGTITNTGCSARDSVTITINPIPVITKTPDTSICKNTSARLFASGGVSYQWSSTATITNAGSQTPTVAPVANTTYYITVTDANTCTNTDSVKVSIKPDPVFYVSPEQYVCTSAPVQLTASGGDSYLWSPAALVSNPVIANPLTNTDATTIYTVHITESTCNNAATLTTTLTLLPPLTITTTKSNDLDCSNGSAKLLASGASWYEWSPPIGLNDTTVGNPVASPLATTKYTVKGSDAKGCVGYDTITVYANYADNNSGYYMPNAFTPNGDGVNDCFGIKYWGNIEKLSFTIYDRWGNKVFYTTDPAGCWDGTYKGQPADAAAYVYFIEAETACGHVERKGTVVLIR